MLPLTDQELLSSHTTIKGWNRTSKFPNFCKNLSSGRKPDILSTIHEMGLLEIAKNVNYNKIKISNLSDELNRKGRENQ